LDRARSFPFRPWVRQTCRRAMLWGGAGLLLGAAVAWALRDPGTATLGRALQILLGYALLFWATLAKILWTARRPAAAVDAAGLLYQPLHAFWPRRLPWGELVASSPKAGSESLRLVVERRGARREVFLNLGLVERRHEFLEALAAGLLAAGLEPVPGERDAFRRRGYADPAAGVAG
jgi:hypothetical protein